MKEARNLWFKGDLEEHDVSQQLVEQHMMLEKRTASAHYIFKLSYHEKTGEFWTFLERKGYRDPTHQFQVRNLSNVFDRHFSF